MNILTSYTLRCLKQNRVRTLVTLIGIILSVALFTAVAEGAYSGRQYLVDVTVAENGAYHGWLDHVNPDKLEQLRQRPELEQTAELEDLGWALVGDTEHQQAYPYLHIVSMSEGFSDLVTVRLLEGRMPENEHELLVSDMTEASTGIKYQVGQLVTVQAGRRVDRAGNTLDEHNPYLYEQERLTDTEERVYTVVGVYDRFSDDVEGWDMPGSLVLTTGASGPNYKFFLTMKHIDDCSEFLYSCFPEIALNGGTNRDLLAYSGATANQEINAVIYGLVAILFALIFLGSVALIYNSFSISVSERTRQFGLLKSIGATKRQTRRAVLTEALLLCAAGIPAGLLLGCGGIGLTLRFLQPAFNSFVNIEGIDGVKIRLVLYAPALALAAGIGLLTALVSAWIPAMRATRLTPIAAIRQSADVKIKPRRVRVSRLTEKLFGFPGTLAAKNFKRSRKQYRSTVISLFMSIVLFISAFTFSDYLRKDIANSVSKSVADVLVYNSNPGLPSEHGKNVERMEALAERLRSAEHIEAVSCAEYRYLDLLIPEQYMSAEAVASQSVHRENGVFVLRCTAYFLQEEEYRTLCAETGADPEARQAVAYVNQTLVLQEDDNTVFRLCPLLRAERLPIPVTMESVKTPEGMVCVGPHYDDGADDNAPPTVAGYEFVPKERCGPDGMYSQDDVVILSREEATEQRELTVGGILRERPLPSSGHELSLYLPASSMGTEIPEDPGEQFVQLYIRAPQHEAAMASVQDAINALGRGDSFSVHDTRSRQESNHSLLLVMNVFTFGFIILISLIAAANVFNTISTNVALRRREFATLKSVGMGNRAFGRMMRFECLLYGAKALLWGLPVSVGVSWLIWKVVDQGFGQGPFRLPWTAMGIAAGSVFLVVFATMFYATWKIKKDNPIDALKQETL